MWVRPHWSKDRQLLISVEPARARVAEHRFDARTGVLELEGERGGWSPWGTRRRR